MTFFTWSTKEIQTLRAAHREQAGIFFVFASPFSFVSLLASWQFFPQQHGYALLGVFETPALLFFADNQPPCVQACLALSVAFGDTGKKSQGCVWLITSSSIPTNTSKGRRSMSSCKGSSCHERWKLSKMAEHNQTWWKSPEPEPAELPEVLLIRTGTCSLIRRSFTSKSSSSRGLVATSPPPVYSTISPPAPLPPPCATATICVLLPSPPSPPASATICVFPSV